MNAAVTQRRSPLLSRRATAAFLLAPLFALVGCNYPAEQQLRRQIIDLENTISHQKSEIASQKTTIDTLHEQLTTARAIKPSDLEMIYYPEKIVIDALSGGSDYDDQPGDDGVTVYIKPIDRDGDIVKVAGGLRIRLFDLANAPEQTLIGEYQFSPAEMRDKWFGDLWTSHYTVKCPWQRTPKHSEITIQAVFTDFLTQRVISTQTTCKVSLASD